MNHWDTTKKPIAIVCHRKCYRLLERECNYKLKFDDLTDFIDFTGIHAILKNTKLYGVMQKYSFGQDFEMQECLKNDKWLMDDPLVNKKNGERILKTWRPIINILTKLTVKILPFTKSLTISL